MAIEFNRPYSLCLEVNLSDNYKTFEQKMDYLINYRNISLVQIRLSPANLLQNRKI